MDTPRLTQRVGVDKHGEPRLAERLGKFRSELMAGDNFSVLAGKSLGKRTAGVPPESVITSQRIPIADDKNSG
jgi:hypothetical protein